MKIHLRSPFKRFMSLCGQGYEWPSGIALRSSDRIAEVTCKDCLRRHKAATS